MALFPVLWNRIEADHPARSLARMQGEMDRMFNGLFKSEWNGTFPAASASALQPPCDIQETESQYLLNMDLPGMTKKDVLIEIQDNTLRVHGERRDERQEKKCQETRTERYFGAIERRFTLPDGIKADGVEAHFENGVLHVAIPKSQAVKPRQIQIGDAKPGGRT